MTTRQLKDRKSALRLDRENDATDNSLRSKLAKRKMSMGPLHSILEGAGEESVSRRRVKTIHYSLFETLRCVETIPQVDGSEFEWEMCQPNLLLARTLQDSKQLAKIYAEKMAEKPSSRESPWRLIVCFDEYTPGSLSHPQPDRKTMDIAFNFLELGASHLSIPSTWMIPVAVRAKKMSQAIGGWSACLARFLRVLLVGDLGMQTVGVAFRFEGQDYELFAALECLVSDGEGLKFALNIMGANGLRPCIRCRNVLKKGSELACLSADGFFVEIGCSDSTKFVPSTPGDLDCEVAAVLAARREFEAGTINKTRFERIETAYGIKANPRGLMSDTRLRLCFSLLRVVHEDWMHGMVQDGCMTIAFQLFIRSCNEKLQVPLLGKLELFLKADWKFPGYIKNKMSVLWKMFSSTAREHQGQDRVRTKGTASEQLGLYILTRHFCETVIVAIAESDGVDLTSELDAYRAWCDVMDKIMLLKQGHAGQVTSGQLVSELARAIDRAIAVQIAVYGSDEITPKSHRMQHIPAQIEKAGFVVDCFLIEKLHLVSKDALTNVHNPARFEGSLLAGICERQRQALRNNIFYGLVGKTVPLHGFLGTLAARKMNCLGMRLAVDDIVFRGEEFGLITACAEDASQAYAIVDVWHKVAQVAPHASRCVRCNICQAWPASEVQQAPCWYIEGAEIVVLTR